MLEPRLARLRDDLAAVHHAAEERADGDAAAAAAHPGGVAHVDEDLAVVVAHALHPVLARGVERPFEADPLLAETADGRKAAAAIVVAAVMLRQRVGAAEIFHARCALMLLDVVRLRRRPIEVAATRGRDERGSHGEREGEARGLSPRSSRPRLGEPKP